MPRGGRPGASTRKRIIARDGNQCAYCRKPAGELRTDGKPGKERMTLDHVVPRSKGGSNDDWNLVMCCHACNSAKGDRLVHEWRPGWLRPQTERALGYDLIQLAPDGVMR